MNRPDADVAVIGGGPAGSTVANRLARLGYRVHIFEASPFPRPHVGESLPASILPLLEPLGVRDAVEAAGVLRSRGAVVRWAGETRHRTDLENGLQVDRGRFDATLLRAALRQGATISQPARVTRADHDGERQWRLHVEGRRPFACRFVVDAAGRPGCLPRRRRLSLQPSTLAVYAYWEGVPLADRETRIEAAGEQWYWAAPLPNGLANATVFLEPGRLRRGTSPQRLYGDAIGASHLLGCYRRGRRVTPVRTCPAGCSRVADPVGGDWLKIGEAAISYDPLSSQGVQRAIVSGLQGAAIINTLMIESKLRHAAQSFCRDRLDENASNHVWTLARLYRQQAAVTPTSFWQSRALGEQTLSEHPPRHRAPSSLDSWVLLGRTVLWRPTPVLVRDEIVVRLALCRPGQRPLVWPEGVPVETLLRGSRERIHARLLLASWSPSIGTVAAHRLLLRLFEHGIVVASPPEPSPER